MAMLILSEYDVPARELFPCGMIKILRCRRRRFLSEVTTHGAAIYCFCPIFVSDCLPLLENRDKSTLR